MNNDIEKYTQVRLAEVGNIFTPAGFMKDQIESGDVGKTRIYIHCPNIYKPEKMEISMVENNGVKDGYAIIPKDKTTNIIYLASFLNTAVAWLFMTDGVIDRKTAITLKRLANIPIRLLPVDQQKAVAYLYYLLQDIKKKKQDGDNNSYIDYWESMYKEVQNAIALELTMPELFKEYEINMLMSWCALIGKCSVEHPNVSVEEMKDILGNELLAPQNVVIGNVKKLRVVMRTITEQMKGQI